MPTKFKDGDVVITDRSANILTGLAIIGIVAVGVTCYRVGYAVGYHGVALAMNVRDKIMTKLNK